MSTLSKISVAASGLTGLVGSRIKVLTADTFSWTNFSPSAGVDIIQSRQVINLISNLPGQVFVNFSAFTDMAAAQKQSGNLTGSCYRLNVIGPKNLSLACKKFHQHLIHLSTDAVFDGQQSTPYLETDQPRPLSWYGYTKLLGEQQILKSGCSFTIIRIAYPFRAEFKSKIDFVRKIIHQLSAGKPIHMFADTKFTPTFIDDLAPALKAIILKKPIGIFHCVGSSIISPFAAAQSIARTFNFNPALIFPSTNPGSYPLNAGLSNHKATSQLGVHFLDFHQALSQLKRQFQSA